jgi:uncharacterized protein
VAHSDHSSGREYLRDFSISSWISPKAELGPSPTHGKGMFAKDQVNKGETVVVFGGDYTDAKGAEKAKGEGKLVTHWDDDLFSVEDRGGDDTYFINHSCDPNVWMHDAFTVVARRNIQPGEEIVADYALFEGDEGFVGKWACRCGSPKCRKIVTGRDWELADIQREYRGHFSPLINKRITLLNK